MQTYGRDIAMEKETNKKPPTTRGFNIFIRNHLFFIGCILFIVTLPLRTRLTNIAIAVMALGWVLDGDPKTKWKNLKVNNLGWWIFLFFAICLVSVLYSENSEVAFSTLETKISLVILPLMIYSSSLSSTRISQILFAFVITMFFTSLYCLGWGAMRYSETGELNYFFYHWLATPINLTAIYFANYLCLAVIIMLFAGENSFLSKKWKLFLIPMVTIIILMLAALSVIGFLLCLGVVFGWYFLRIRFSFLKSLMLISMYCFVFAAMIWILPYTKTKVLKMNDLHYEMNYPDSVWNTVTIRLAKWKCASAVIEEHPLLGVGIGDEYEALMKSYTQHNFSEGLRNVYNEHNQFLASLVATGLPGFSVLIAMLLLPLWKALKHYDYLLLAFLVLMLFSFMTENFLYIQKGVLFFGFFYALLIKRFSIQHKILPSDH